jgi:hypothetical protein
MKRIALILFLLSSLFFSCTKEQIKIDPDNLLIGVWVFSEYKDDVTIFNRDQEFIDNDCFKFNSDGTLIERKNSGWCGTPPISYANYDGTWSIVNDTLIQVKVGYWGGTTSYKLDIESISPTTLKVITLPNNE